MDIVLVYQEGGLTYSNAFYDVTVVGLNEPDRLRKNAVVHEYLDGGIGEQTDGFFKEPIELSFDPPLTALERRFLSDWFLASRKWVSSGNYLSEGITQQELLSEWLYDCETNRQFTIQLFDTHKYYEFQDVGPIADEDMYCRLNVLITGTSLAPQTFVTGTAPIALMETGEAWPVFSDATHVHKVVLTPNSSCQFIPCLVANATVVAGNVVFQAFVSDMQSPASDGSFYVDIQVFLQERP